MSTQALPIEVSHEERMLREAVYGIAASFGPEYFFAASQTGDLAEVWAALGKEGYLGVNLPQEHGGGGLGLHELAAVLEESARAGIPLFYAILNAAIVGSILSRWGTAEQKERWLPGIASGRELFAFAVTEPEAGSNSQRMTTVARRDEDKYVLHGLKHYISGIDKADRVMVLARTGPVDDGGSARLSLFVVDRDAPGLTFEPVPTAVQVGERQFTVSFTDVELDAGRLVGAEHHGLKVAWDGLNPERIGIAALCNGIAAYALERASRYAKERVVWAGKPIGIHQGVSHALAEAKIELELARLMTAKAAALFDAEMSAGEASNMAKYAAAEAAIRCVDAAMHVHGGNGLALEYRLANYYFIVRLFRTAPTPREMVLNYVAERALGLPRSY